MFRAIFFRTWVLYVMAGLALALTWDSRKIAIRHLNGLQEFGESTVATLNGTVKPDKRRIRIALMYYRQVTDLFPGMARGEEMQGFCYGLLGNDRKAIEMFSRALKKKPEYFWVSFARGAAWYRWGDYRKARQDFEQVAARENEELVRAAIISSLGKMPPEERQKYFIQAGMFGQKMKFLGYQMSLRCALRLKDSGLAVDIARRALEDPGCPRKEYFLVLRVLLEQSSLEAAVRDPRLEGLFSEDIPVVIHPWAASISPGKEGMFN